MTTNTTTTNNNYRRVTRIIKGWRIILLPTTAKAVIDEKSYSYAPEIWKNECKITVNYSHMPPPPHHPVLSNLDARVIEFQHTMYKVDV